MTFALGILTFFVVLAVLILVHELGHFSMAKLMGVRVEEFGLGFPPRLRSVRRGGTVYSLNLLPLGGFVKMLGENGETELPDSFGSKAPWQRLLILVAGPGMNLLLALSIAYFVFLAGVPRGLTVVTQVQPGSPAQHAGLQDGDRIVAVDGRSVSYIEDLQLLTKQREGERVTVEYQRGRHLHTTSLVPRRHPGPTQGPMGIRLEKTAIVSYGPTRSFRMALDQIGLMINSVPLLIQSVSQQGGAQVSGPIGIAHATTEVVQQEPRQGIAPLFEFVAVLSANLGVLNLLPIPALDGGRVVFVLVSWVRRRNTDPELEGLIHLVGMALLLTLIVLISYQDIVRWVSGGSF